MLDSNLLTPHIARAYKSTLNSFSDLRPTASPNAGVFVDFTNSLDKLRAAI